MSKGGWSEAELLLMAWRKQQKSGGAGDAKVSVVKEQKTRKKRRRERSSSRSRSRYHRRNVRPPSRPRSRSSSRGSRDHVSGSPPPDPVRLEHDLRTLVMRRGYQPSGRSSKPGKDGKRRRDRSRSNSPRRRGSTRTRSRSKGKDRKDSDEERGWGIEEKERGRGGDDRDRSPGVDRFGRMRRKDQPRSPSPSPPSSPSLSGSIGKAASPHRKGGSRSRSASRSRSPGRPPSPGPDRPKWQRDKYADEGNEEQRSDSSPRRLPSDYVPPQPTWKSKAGGVYIPLKPK